MLEGYCWMCYGFSSQDNCPMKSWGQLDIWLEICQKSLKIKCLIACHLFKKLLYEFHSYQSCFCNKDDFVAEVWASLCKFIGS